MGKEGGGGWLWCGDDGKTHQLASEMCREDGRIGFSTISFWPSSCQPRDGTVRSNYGVGNAEADGDQTKEREAKNELRESKRCTGPKKKKKVEFFSLSTKKGKKKWEKLGDGDADRSSTEIISDRSVARVKRESSTQPGNTVQCLSIQEWQIVCVIRTWRHGGSQGSKVVDGACICICVCRPGPCLGGLVTNKKWECPLPHSPLVACAGISTEELGEKSGVRRWVPCGGRCMTPRTHLWQLNVQSMPNTFSTATSNWV
jgi:hypothetical protein